MEVVETREYEFTRLTYNLMNELNDILIEDKICIDNTFDFSMNKELVEMFYRWFLDMHVTYNDVTMKEDMYFKFKGNTYNISIKKYDTDKAKGVLVSGNIILTVKEK